MGGYGFLVKYGPLPFDQTKFAENYLPFKNKFKCLSENQKTVQWEDDFKAIIKCI